MRSITYAVKTLLALAVCAPGLVMAADLTPNEAAPQIADSAQPAGVLATDASAKVEPAPATVLGMGPALSGDQLEKYRGGTDVVSNDMTLNGTVAHNSASEVVTGSNAINGAAFANTSGFATVIQNTGANVLIQNATIVNVQYK